MWPLDNIDLEALEERSPPDRWGLGDPKQDRRVYVDRERGLYFKVWAPEYADHRRVWYGREQTVLALDSIFGIAIGFYDDEIASAFVDTIVDAEGACRGYVTRAGRPFDTSLDPAFTRFLESVMAATVRTQFAHTDVCYNNVVLVDGRYSFIDFDTVFTHLPLLDEAYEVEMGCLRPHVYPAYRNFVVEERRRLQRRALTSPGRRAPAHPGMRQP